MSNIPVLNDSPGDTRFAGLTEDERGVIHFALQQTAKRIMDKAAADEYAKDDLDGAGGMFHLASSLASEVGVTLGEQPANAESLEMAALCIADGEAPFAARMAAEVEEMLGPERRYPVEVLGENEDDGTMPENVAQLEKAVIGRRIVKAESEEDTSRRYCRDSLTLTLDDGTRVRLVETSDCCAFTNLKDFLLHPEMVDHAIIGVGTTGQYTKWHIYADLGDVLEMDVDWSCGNPFYYGYGFDIAVEAIEPIEAAPLGAHADIAVTPEEDDTCSAA